jgi:hypothetical protein
LGVDQEYIEEIFVAEVVDDSTFEIEVARKFISCMSTRNSVPAQINSPVIITDEFFLVFIILLLILSSDFKYLHLTWYFFPTLPLPAYSLTTILMYLNRFFSSSFTVSEIKPVIKTEIELGRLGERFSWVMFKSSPSLIFNN